MNKKVSLGGAGFVLFIVLLTSVAPVSSQEVEDRLLVPTGPHQIGRTSRHWIDETRNETLGDNPNVYRELELWIWYPGEVATSSSSVPYFGDFTGPQRAEAIATYIQSTAWLGLDSSSPAFQDIIQLNTHAYVDVPVSKAQPTYPVLIFSTGSTVIPENSTIQIEELASHGYIVIGINHPYISGVTMFPDGRLVGAGSNDDPEVAAQDIIFVVDQLEMLNTGDPQEMFTGRLDLEKIGIWGWSVGGKAVVLAAPLDSRIQAVLSEDGGVFQVNFEQPFMYFTTQATNVYAQGPYHAVWVPGFEHLSFFDGPVWPEWTNSPSFGTIAGPRTVEIVRTHVLAFFDKYLKGEAITLLDAPSPDYPEVEMQSSLPDTD